MRRTCLLIAVFALPGVLPATSHADSYNYEIGIEYGADRATTESVFESPFLSGSGRSESDDDGIELFGTWYFDGVSGSDGPRSRAAFISRASSVSFSYLHGNGDSVSTVSFGDPTFPPSTSRTEQTTNNFSANLRWVWSQSGWYALAGFSSADLELDSESLASEINADAYSLGFGKYIGDQTTLELSLLRQEAEVSGAVLGGSSNSTEVALGFTHIGGLGGEWQYGADIGLSTTGRGSSDGSYNVRLSLYPSRSLAFGLETDGALQDRSEASERYGLFASWFPSERIELGAHYGRLRADEPSNTDIDQYDFGVGVTFRF
jgi:hypothetical protein